MTGNILFMLSNKYFIRWHRIDHRQAVTIEREEIPLEKLNEKPNVLSVSKTSRLQFARLNPSTHSQGDALRVVRHNLWASGGNTVAVAFHFPT